MSLKFGKDRAVSFGYAMVPLFYTGIKHPHNKNKELVLMDYMGGKFTACWRNNKLHKVGIEFLVKAVDNGFVFKDKVYPLGNRVY